MFGCKRRIGEIKTHASDAPHVSDAPGAQKVLCRNADLVE